MTPERDEIDPDAPPSEDEIRESERLRDALADASKENADAELLRAVKSAADPRPIDTPALDASVKRGLDRFDDARRPTGGIVIRVAFGVTTLVAAAAIALFWFGSSPVTPTQLAHARSTQSLFAEHFDSRGGESARIDRIALARAADLRENHYARWGVRDRGRR